MLPFLNIEGLFRHLRNGLDLSVKRPSGESHDLWTRGPDKENETWRRNRQFYISRIQLELGG